MRLITIIIAAALAFGASAQTTLDGELHVQALTLEKPSKEAKKEAAKLKKEGWEPLVNEADLASLINASYLLDLEISDEGYPVYIKAEGLSDGPTLNLALAKAKAYAMAGLANQMHSRMISERDFKIESTASQTADTNYDIDVELRAATEAALTNAFPVFALYRERRSGDYEVLYILAIKY